jgi:Tol biopolymer transport system component
MTDPSEPIRLTFDTGHVAYPNWANDGFIRYEYYGNSKISETYRMSAKGEEQSPVANLPGLAQGNLSPDGKRVFYAKREDPPQFYLADAYGQNEE